MSSRIPSSAAKGQGEGGNVRPAKTVKSVHAEAVSSPHESPRVMTWPLILLAAGTVLLSIFGTPFWPWFHAYLSGHLDHLSVSPIHDEVWLVMLISTAVVACGIFLGWRLYGQSGRAAATTDPLERVQPDVYGLLRVKYFIDEFYDHSIVRFTSWVARLSDWLDRIVWNGLVQLTAYAVVGVSWLNRLLDEFVVNGGFDRGCGELRRGSRWLSWWQNGQVQRYLRSVGLGMVVLALVFLWGCRP